MALSYNVSKADLRSFQINQLQLLKTHLPEIKKQKFLIFPDCIKIDENGNEFKFSFENISDNQQQATDILYLVLKTHLIEQIVELIAYLNTLNIFLPILNISCFFNTSQDIITDSFYEEEDSFSNQDKQVVITKFWFEKKDENQMQNKIYIAPELKDQFVEKGNIIFDEKMTVFALGYLMTNILTNSLENETIDIRNTDFLKQRFSYEIVQYHTIIEDCIEVDPEKRPTLKQIHVQLQRLQRLSQYTKKARELQTQGLISNYLKQENLNKLVINILNLKNDQLETGRIYIQQNLCKIKFIYQLLQPQIKNQNEQYSMQYMILQEIYHQLDEIEKLKNYKLPNSFPKSDDVPYNFNDSIDQIDEFRNKFLDVYLEKLLLPLINEALQKNENCNTFNKKKDSQVHATKLSYFSPQLKRYSKNELHQIIYMNLDMAFKQINLYSNFPILLNIIQEQDFSYFDIYDQLLNLIFREGNHQSKMLQQLKKNLKL